MAIERVDILGVQVSAVNMQQAVQTIAEWDNERMVLGFRQAVEYVTINTGK